MWSVVERFVRPRAAWPHGAPRVHTPHDRIISFSPVTGLVRVEAELLANVLALLVGGRGWRLPVELQGTASVGEAVAYDSYGPGHPVDGSFGSHVSALRLRTPAGAVVDCGPTSNRSLFTATVGGAGVTGTLLEVEFALSRPRRAVRILKEIRDIGCVTSDLSPMSFVRWQVREGIGAVWALEPATRPVPFVPNEPAPCWKATVNDGRAVGQALALARQTGAFRTATIFRLGEAGPGQLSAPRPGFALWFDHTPSPFLGPALRALNSYVLRVDGRLELNSWQPLPLQAPNLDEARRGTLEQLLARYDSNAATSTHPSPHSS